MIIIDTKNYILDKYYNEHEKPSIIAKEICVNPSYITKIVKVKYYRNKIQIKKITENIFEAS